MNPRHNRHNLLGMAFVGPGFLYILLIVIYPLCFSLWASFTNMRLTSPIARFVGLDTYAQALGNEIFRESLIVTGLFLVTVVVLEFILGFALAFSFSRMRGTHPVMRALLLLPVMATPQTGPGSPVTVRTARSSGASHTRSVSSLPPVKSSRPSWLWHRATTPPGWAGTIRGCFRPGARAAFARFGSRM